MNIFGQIRSFFLVLVVFLVGASGVQAQLDTVMFNVGCADGVSGSSHCVDVTVDNFTDILSYQFAINFNPNVVSITSINVDNSCLTDLTSDLFSLMFIDFGYITTLWYDDDAVPRSCPDGAILFSICYDLIGDPGTCSPILINSTNIEFIVEDENGELPTEVTYCESCIIANDLTIVSNYCETSPADNDGSLRFYAVGGAELYNYTVTLLPGTLIESGTLSEGEEWNRSGLASGMYRIDVTDANGLMKTKTINLTQNFAIEYSLNFVNPTCFNRKNGSASISPITGGQNPYKIAWSNGIYGVNMINDLAIGTYEVSVTDATGCQLIKSFDLSVDTLKAQVQIIDSLFCNTARNGKALFTGIGGVPKDGNQYEYWINNIRRSYRVEQLEMTGLKECNLLYIVDNAAVKCTSQVISFKMPIKNEMKINTEVLQNVICKGDLDGKVRISAKIGNETNFIFSLQTLPSGNPYTPGGTSSSNFHFNNNVIPGDYQITIESFANECKDTFYFNITEPDEALVVNSNVDNPSCTGNDGIIVVTPTGGVPDYTYDWGIVGEDTNTLTGLNGGDFKVLVTDMNGCQDSLEFNLPMGGDLMANANILSAINCSGNEDGSVIVNVSPAGTYTYIWSDANGMNIGSTQSVDNLKAGWYFVSVSATGCTAIDSVFLSDPAGLVFDDAILTAPDCPDQKGNIGVVVSGGFPNYDYIWTRCDSTTVLGINSVLAGVAPGDYQVVVSDQSGCEIDTCVTLINPPKIIVQVSNIVKVACNGENSGSASALASGGSQGAATFNYLWSSGETGPNAIMLAAGNGWVIASDNKCASDTIKFVVPNALPLSVIEEFTPPSCAEDCDASITILPSGGTMNNFTIEWPDLGLSSLMINDLCANTYNYTVRDGNNCEFMGSVVISAPDTLFLVLDSILTREVSCRTNEGQIATKATGGNGNYTFTWTNNISTKSVAVEVPPGIYTATVIDENGCTASLQYTLDPVSLVTAVIPTPKEPNCFGELTCLTVTSAAGGVGGPYSFQVDSGPRIPLDSCLVVFAGQHRINVFDEAGCSLDTTLFIDQPNKVTVELGDDLEVIIGEEADLIVASIDSDLLIDSIGWSLLDSYECVVTDDCKEIIVAPVVDQTVKVYVRDINGCDDTDELNIIIKDIRQVYFPNIFSPDGDGFNDFFQAAIGPGVEIINNLIIYDRWGNKMYQQQNFIPDPALTDGWDGRFSGNDAQPGVYVYYLQATFKDNRVLTYAGDITLIR